MERKLESVENEGCKIYLARYGYTAGHERMGRMLDSRQFIISSGESPRGAFESLFPRYHINSYLGVSLWGFWDGLSFFSRHPMSGLTIEGDFGGTGNLKSLYLTKISGALRKPIRREKEYLQEEANIILEKILPRLNILGGWGLVGELGLAFRNLELAD